MPEPEPVWRAELPRRTGHSKSGVWLGIERLAASGLLEARRFRAYLDEVVARAREGG